MPPGEFGVIQGRVFRLLICFWLFFSFGFPGFPYKALALETEQYTLPPVPLQDAGVFLNEWVHQNLMEVLATSAALVRPPLVIAKRLYRRLTACETVFGLKFNLAGGYCITRRFEFWMEDRDFLRDFNQRYGGQGPIGFRAKKSIYVRGATSGLTGWFSHNGAWDNWITFRGFSSTLKVFDVLLGTDKFGHFFKQGYQYFERFWRLREAGMDEESSRQSVVREFGQKTENGWLGRRLTGIYGNADLAANFAGMIFYQNLFEEVRVDGAKLPPLLVFNDADGKWELNPGVFEDPDVIPLYLRAYFTEHLNEALNPNWFQDPACAEVIFSEVKKRCPRWKAEFPGRDGQYYQALAQELMTWHGEFYGYREQPRGAFTVGAACY